VVIHHDNFHLATLGARFSQQLADQFSRFFPEAVIDNDDG
jgi:hypothetical protein